MSQDYLSFPSFVSFSTVQVSQLMFISDCEGNLKRFFLINCCTINHFPWLRLHGKRWRFQLFEKCEIVITHGQYSFVLSWANTIENCLSFSCCNERRPISPFWLDILLVYHYTGIGSKGMEAKTTDIWEHKRILRNYMPGTHPYLQGSGKQNEILMPFTKREKALIAAIE